VEEHGAQSAASRGRRLPRARLAAESAPRPATETNETNVMLRPEHTLGLFKIDLSVKVCIHETILIFNRSDNIC